MRTLIAWAGDDPDREGLVDTPRRVARAYEELFSGYREDPSKPLKRVFRDVSGYQDLVLVRDIAFVSHCEHHIAPFFGKAHIGYYPRGGVVGLSKLARIVDAFARRLQTQEALSAQIIGAIEELLETRGVAVMLEAEHTCMAMRGVREAGRVHCHDPVQRRLPRRSERADALLQHFCAARAEDERRRPTTKRA